mmetsp:Transcript_55446/g.142872  ORF Transcript_55446/g.142872 Transcript_55446/m.142872 type:complete len:436 (-) Transcript_55446:77-1384(-)
MGVEKVPAAGALLGAVRRGRISAVDRLLTEGAAVNQKDAKGCSALHIAAQEGHAMLAQLLLRSGADLDVDALEMLLGVAGHRPSLPSSAWPLPLAPPVPRSPLKPQLFEPVDLAPFVRPQDFTDEDRARSARQWDECFRTLGFGLIEGHGIEEDLIEDLRIAATMFFQSTSDYKHRFYQGPTMTGRSGYSPVRDSTVPQAGHSDPVEGYTFIRQQQEGLGCWDNPSEKHPEQLNGIGQRYCGEVERVMHALHRMSALALGLDISYFDEFYSKPASVLVVSHYPPLRAPIKVPEGKLRYRAHSDYSGFTILLQDPGDFGPGGGSGLEIDIAGAWVPVQPKKGALVVNIGDLFELWTNDRWRSTPHRVTSPRLRDPAAGKSRLTAMLFSGPNLDSVISPIDTCVDEKHPSRYGSMTAAQHMADMWKTKSKEARYKPG